MSLLNINDDFKSLNTLYLFENNGKLDSSDEYTSLARLVFHYFENYLAGEIAPAAYVIKHLTFASFIKDAMLTVINEVIQKDPNKLNDLIVIPLSLTELRRTSSTILHEVRQHALLKGVKVLLIINEKPLKFPGYENLSAFIDQCSDSVIKLTIEQNGESTLKQTKCRGQLNLKALDLKLSPVYP